MTNKDFNHRCGTVFGLSILFVLLVGLMLIGFDVLRSILFEPTMTDAANLLDALFDTSLNALKGD